MLDEAGNPMPSESQRRGATASKRADATPRQSRQQWPATRAIRLHSLGDVQNELARVYRGIARGELDPSAGTKLTYVLGVLGKVMESSLLEARIARLEQAGTPLALPYEQDDDDGAGLDTAN